MPKFRTRARAVDMLGRQQIAGIPTAISELFKNAHDAYADKVEVDYFRDEDLFVLRDDGIGMTKSEFEERWLTIGTESKMQVGKNVLPPPRDPNKSIRPILGEKGIGRLSIGIVGPQVLILTRAERNGKVQDLVAAFIHWGLFQCPGINIDQIEIPVQTFKNGSVPKRSDVLNLVKTVKENLMDLSENIDEDMVSQIITDLDNFTISPHDLSKTFGKLTLADEARGTHFYIHPTNEAISAEIENDLQGKEISRLRRLLLGFTNTMTSKAKPPIRPAFRYWPSRDESPTDLISDREFFMPEEFTEADHHILGKFDKYGKFTGTVQIFDQKSVEESIPWPKGLGKPATCGPFKLDIAYVQGEARRSKLPAAEYAVLDKKVERLGGIYIYRDGIRVLPYGDPQFDFLLFEERRTRSASYYFFSYRRFMGAIEITRDGNGNLVEKAGREGFQENKAYREFRDILYNFFIQIAANYFRPGGKYSQIFEKRREELDRTERAKREREKRSLTSRREFERKLDNFFKRISEGQMQDHCDSIIDEFNVKADALRKQNDPEHAEKQLLVLEANAMGQLKTVRDESDVDKPPGVGLTKNLQRDWEAYLSERENLEEKIFLPTEAKIKAIGERTAKDLKLRIDKVRRAKYLLNEMSAPYMRDVKKQVKETNEDLDHLYKRIHKLADDILESMDRIISGAKETLNNTDHVVHEDFLSNTQNRLSENAKRYITLLSLLRSQVGAIRWFRSDNSEILTEADMTAALEDELLAYRERSETDFALTQLGMAIEIIGHEFGNAVKSIRNNLKRLKDWADANPDLNKLYSNIRTSFDHLDGYLNLFTPLQRRLYRSTVPIIGSNIFDFLKALFTKGLDEYGIELKATENFRNSKIMGYPSTFYPVFINLVDNAMFWLKDQKSHRKIIMDAQDGMFIVSDTGPGVQARDREAIFEMGFTRKPGGRGLGLFIARETLKSQGYTLEIRMPTSTKRGATFIIRKLKENS